MVLRITTYWRRERLGIYFQKKLADLSRTKTTVASAFPFFKSQYNNVGLGQNNFVVFPSFLFCPNRFQCKRKIISCPIKIKLVLNLTERFNTNIFLIYSFSA